jgi:alpha-beta hydrolase superfamily lysophospholipase
LVRRALRALVYGVLGGLLVLLVVGVRLLNARPDLQVWHLADLDAEFTTESPVSSFAGYLELEQRLFDQLEARVEEELPPRDRTHLNRYHAGSLADPGRWPVDWNRSFELPTLSPTAGVLLLHGMSDSPYSLRNLGQALHARGAWVVGLRLPGHGTAPSGLVRVRWQDMAAAAQLALGHLHEEVGDAPLYVIGYSNGAALAVNHAISALEDPSLTRPDGLVLISPSIGVTPLAVFAVWQARLGSLLGLPKLAWSSILPEYDPFKYNSFAVNAGDQVQRLTTAIGNGLERLRRDERLQDFPPVLAFQSLTDATVSTRAVIDRLFLRLPAGGHDLVLFDLNRWAAAEDLLRSDPKGPIQADLGQAPLPFSLSFITNESETSLRVVQRRKRAGAITVQEHELDLAWPRGIFSLSHIALPFPETDPLYGGPAAPPSPGIQLGRAELRGERDVLLVSATDLMRLRWNPFYALVEERVLEAIGLAGPEPEPLASPQ